MFLFYFSFLIYIFCKIQIKNKEKTNVNNARQSSGFLFHLLFICWAMSVQLFLLECVIEWNQNGMVEYSIFGGSKQLDFKWAHAERRRRRRKSYIIFVTNFVYMKLYKNVSFWESLGWYYCNTHGESHSIKSSSSSMFITPFVCRSVGRSSFYL